MMKFGDNTNHLMNAIAFKFWKVFYGASEPQPRWRVCVNKVANTLGFAVGALYVERTFDELAKKEVLWIIT
jgi:neprilysin